MIDKNDLPNTIKHPDNFINSQWSIDCPDCGKRIGFDGVFPWGWIINELRIVDNDTKITPTDFDCVIERHSHYLVIETKDVGKSIDKGQEIALKNLQHPKSFTVVKLWGKNHPEKMELVKNDGTTYYETDRECMQRWIRRWFRMANNDIT